jgi:hypothetical protein
MGNLKSHICNHTGEKPYACFLEGCDKKYSRLCRLKIHQRTHVSLIFILMMFFKFIWYTEHVMLHVLILFHFYLLFMYIKVICLYFKICLLNKCRQEKNHLNAVFKNVRNLLMKKGI